MSDVFATAGQWVTDEDGNKVCRLASDLHRHGMVKSADFTDWQIEAPAPYSRLDDVPGFRTNKETRKPQVHIEGEWLP